MKLIRIRKDDRELLVDQRQLSRYEEWEQIEEIIENEEDRVAKRKQDEAVEALVPVQREVDGEVMLMEPDRAKRVIGDKKSGWCVPKEETPADEEKGEPDKPAVKKPAPRRAASKGKK